MYPIIEEFLKEDKNCIKDYVGTELHMGSDRKMRADVYGISNDEENSIYLLEGKLKLERRIHFSKVLCEAMPLLELADFVYIFGIPDDEDFINRNKKYVEVCELLGIGIILISGKGKKNIILEAQRNNPDIYSKKETVYRIFLKEVDSPISNLIFQACYEYMVLKNNDDPCVQFIDIYNTLFSDEKYKKILKKILKEHKLSKMGMRREFQNKYHDSDLVEITRMNTVYEDYICLTKKGIKECEEKGSPPILLDK